MRATRRHFLRSSGAAGLGLPAAARQGGLSANESIRFATIGLGGMGTAGTETAIAVPGTKLAAVCDVYDGRLARAREAWGQSLAVTRDYREILNRGDIDAVIVATPDHWHARIANDAMLAGKDVYVEKPMVRNWEEGQQLIETARKRNRILQVGSQRVSSVVYAKARELYRSGAIGELNMVEAWWDRNSSLGAWRYSIPPDAGPKTVGWDLFLGPAPRRPFDAQRLFQWRNWRDYGTGVAGDLFVHLFSGLHFVTGAIGPVRVFASGGLRFWTGDRDVPDILMGLYDYPQTDHHPAFNLSLRVNFASGAGETTGFRFTGSEGILTIGQGVTLARPPEAAEPGMTPGGFSRATQEEIIREYRRQHPPRRQTAGTMTESGEERWLPPRGYSDLADHYANFFAAVRSRKPVVEDATFGLRAAGPAVVSNTSYFERRIVRWDPAAMRVAQA
jgi:predicted dehydrogenase